MGVEGLKSRVANAPASCVTPLQVAAVMLVRSLPGTVPSQVQNWKKEIRFRV